MDIERKVTSPVKNPDNQQPQKTPVSLAQLNLWPKYRLRLMILVLVILAIAGVAATLYYRTRLEKLRQDPNQVALKETEDILAKVGKLIVLPEGERPTIATISDPELLKDQPFFAHAKKGDKVLIYTIAKKGILYDPVANKILEVAPINLGTSPTGPTITPPAQPGNP